jgi:hypothetical protein
MTTPIDHQRHENNSADGRRQRRRAKLVIFAGAAAIATLALFDAASLGTRDTTVPSGSVRLVDQATDVPPAPPPPPGFELPPGTVLPPGTQVLPGGLLIPPLPPGVVMPPIPPEAIQMVIQGEQMLAAGPPPNVPNEVCRYNTVRVPCPPVP